MKNYWIVVIFLVIVTSCIKKVDSTIYLSEDIKRNFSFKPGTYWIYRDSISGRIDSCYVNTTRLFIGNDGYKTSNPFEVMSISLKQKPIDNNIKEETNWGISFIKGILHASCNKKINDKQYDAIILFETGYPISTNMYNNYPCNTVKYEKFSLGTNLYFNVSNVYAESKDYVSFYFNDSIGYIKMKTKYESSIFNAVTKGYDTLKINEVWELQRFHVIR